MSGRDAQRGFIFQSIIAMIECLERDDWDEVKLEPDTDNDKTDIHLYKSGEILSAIQVKSSKNQFERANVERWLEELRKDAIGAKETIVYLVGDLYSSVCNEYIEGHPEIKKIPFYALEETCRARLQDYVASVGLNNLINDEELQIAYNNFFAEIHNNSISDNPLCRDDLNQLLKRVLIIPKCLTKTPGIDRNVGIIGRDEVMQNLRKMLDENGCIALISGLGGIGKTAVMRWICNSIKEDGNVKDHVAWITCGETLQDDIVLLRDAFGIPDSDDEKIAFNKIIERMKRFRGTLYLFMDNMYRNPDEGEMDILNSLYPNVHIMISSRHKLEDIPFVDLDVLEHDPAVEMFYRYYGRDQERVYKSTAGDIVDTVYRHTLLVELLAKAAGRSGGTLEDFNKELLEKEFYNVFNRPIKTKHDKKLTIEESVIKLYEVSGLTEEQQRIMKLFSIFTAEKEIYYKVVEWAGLDPIAMDELVDLAWLEQGGLENGYHIHQIIKDSLMRQIETNREEMRLEDYGQLSEKVADMESYIPKNLEYTKVRERLALGEDIAKVNEERTNWLLRSEKWSENDKKLLQKTALLFNNIGNVHEGQGDYKKALEYYEKSKAIRERVLGVNHADTATTYNNIAGIYKAYRDHNTALEYYNKSLEIREQVLKHYHRDTAITYNNMAGVYKAQGKYKKALEYYEESLKIKEQVLKKDDPSIAITYNNTAGVYKKLKSFVEALEYYQKSIEIKERTIGKDHPSTAKTYHNIAGVYRELKYYGEAMKYYDMALAIKKRVLGENHPSTAKTLNSIAWVYRDQGDYENALKLYEKALFVRRKRLGDDHHQTQITKYAVDTMKYYIESGLRKK